VFIGRAPVPAKSFDPQSLCETRSDADRLTIRRRRPAGHPASRSAGRSCARMCRWRRAPPGSEHSDGAGCHLRRVRQPVHGTSRAASCGWRLVTSLSEW